MAPRVGIIMGSKSDLDLVKGAFDTLKEFNVEYEARVLSAHRTPVEAANYASTAAERGLKVLCCFAGMAAHLGGVVASYTTLPVVGVPLPAAPFNGWDATLAMLQMPPGVPVATVTAGKAGGKNAALYAISILALEDKELAKKLQEFRQAQHDKVLAADAELQQNL